MNDTDVIIEELSEDQYRTALMNAYALVRIVKGLPFDSMDAMATRAKIGAPFAVTPEQQEQKRRFDRDCIVVERFAALQAAFNTLLPDIKPVRMAGAVRLPAREH